MSLSDLNYQDRCRTVPRLLGGWDTSPEEFENLGFTMGLPPGYYAEDENKGVKALSETLRSIWADFNCGPASSHQSTMFDPRQLQVLVRSFPDDFNSNILHNALEFNMKKFIPGYLGDGIYSIRIEVSKRVASVTFVNEDICRMFKQTYDLYDVGGRSINVSPSNSPSDEIHCFGAYIRSFLGNVIINGCISDEELISSFPNIYKITHPQEKLTIVTFRTADEASSFVLMTKDQYDSSVLNFPPPTENPLKSNLPPTAVTTVTMGDKLSLSSIMDNKAVLTGAVDAESMTRFPNLKTLNIYNVVDTYLLSDTDALMVIASDMNSFCKQYGEVKNFQILPPESKCGKFGKIKISFSDANSARKCQNDIAGKIYLGNVVVTQLSI